MAFSFAVIRRTIFGNVRVVYGTFNSAGVTTGSIVTGFNTIENFSVTYFTVRAGATATATAGTIALAGLTSGDTGSWIVYGR